MTVHRKDFTIMGTPLIPGAWQVIQKIKGGLTLKHEPNNKYGADTVAVCWGTKKIGYLPLDLAKNIAPLLDAGFEFECARSATRIGGAPRVGVFTLAWDDGASN